MRTAYWWGIIIFLLVVIAVLAWILFATPAPAQTPTIATSTTPTVATSTPASTGPLHDRVVVASPVASSTVGQSFTVSGEAPGAWYFEAVFPIKVFDENDNTIAVAQGQTQGDWTTGAQVPFTATIQIQGGYTGPATLVLIKDNESGLPQNDDSVVIPIVIQ